MRFFKKVVKRVKKLWSRSVNWVKTNKGKAIRLGILAFLIFFTINEAVYEATKPETVPYNDFITELRAGNVDTVYYDADTETMRFTLHNDKSRTLTEKEKKDYEHPDEDWRITTYPANDDFRREVLRTGSDIKIQTFEPLCETIFSLMVSLGIPIAIFILFWYLISGGAASKFNTDEIVKKTDVKFDDVIGHTAVKQDLQFLVKLMNNLEKGKEPEPDEINAQVPKGILFSGEPGTGKTLLAKAIAGECGVPFLYMNASSFIELYVGVGAKRVRALFKKAKQLAPCVLFIDEIDAVGGKRGRENTSSEDRQTINALLQEMDGFDTQSGVLVIAATNNSESLDKALVRSGRFDREIVIAPPKDWKERAELFDFYLKDTPTSVNTESVAKQTLGFTGADIAAVTNEAKLIARMRDATRVTTDDIESAIDKHFFKGNRVKREKLTEDNKIVAYHEAGHAVVAFLCQLPIARASVIGSTSGVGGMVMQEETDSQFQTKRGILQQVSVAYGGRCSERIKFGDVTTGAASDITQATKYLKAYIERYGFDEKTGMLDLSVLRADTVISDADILKKMTGLATKLENAVTEMLKENYDLVELLAQALIERETIAGDEIENMLKNALKKRG